MDLRANPQVPHAFGAPAEPPDHSLDIIVRVYGPPLFVGQDVTAGEVFTGENVRSILPGDELHTLKLNDVLGRPAARDTLIGTPLSWHSIG